MSHLDEIRELLSPRFRYRTIALSLPHLWRHATLKPFRRSGAAQFSTAALTSPEYRRVAHDVYCGMLLQGYRQATHLLTSPDSGLAIVLFMIFIFTFDQEFEHLRTRHESSDFASLMGAPTVRSVWQSFTTYCRQFPHGPDAIDAVLAQFEQHYEPFCMRERIARETGDMASVLNLVELDSGLTLFTVYEIIRLFNGHDVDPVCARQFHAVGMAGKFLDDIRDVAEDVRAGIPNLYYAATAACAEERQTLTRAIRKREQLSAGWLGTHCPSSHRSFTELTIAHYHQVLTPALRLPLDICWSLIGSDRYWRRPIRRSPEAFS